MTVSVPENKTNTVKFGDYAIALCKDQLEYYVSGQLVRVRDVKSDFSFDDLYLHGVNLSEARNAGPVTFVKKDQIVKKY